MTECRISFVTALHNCLPLTQAMLASLRATVSDFSDKEIVLIDDASTDGTSEYLASLSGDSRYLTLRNDENLGFAASNNRAVAAAHGEIILFLNNDLELSPGWLEPMLELLETLPDAGAVGNIQRNFATGLIDHAGIFFDLEGMPTHAHKNRANPPSGPWKERNAITAACLAMKRALFLDIGGFDEGYRNGVEDVDLSIRLRQAGYRLYVSHCSIVRHHVSVSPGRNLHNDRNSLRFKALWSEYARNFGQKEWAPEYFRRYARFWWRMNPRLAIKALFLLCLNPPPKR